MFYIIPGWLISLVTFPGVIIHEIAHRLFCDITGVTVYGIKYFFLDPDSDTVGCVWHGGSNRISDNLLIALAPLLVNTIVCCICTFPYMSQMYLLGECISHEHYSIQFSYSVLAWIGLSAGGHAFPSDQDMQSIAYIAEYHENMLVAFLLSHLVTLVYMLNVFNRILLSFAYAWGISQLFAQAVWSPFL